ncbi:MAG: transposase [Gemmatimonadaceae bacterium]|nr:transposase [Gemmatimonadaceae bacterium]
MARWPRLIAPGLPIHITQRGHNQDRTFLDELDFACYRECLLESSRRYACAIHAYALMSNHVHMLVTPRGVGSAANLMRSIGSRYVRYWNKRHRRTGTLWEGRFRSALVGDDQYLLRCCRYIDMNPVKAGIVHHPAEYEWSSYRALALGDRDELVSPHPTYTALDTITEARRASYAAYCAEQLDEARVLEIRRATRGGTALGNSARLDDLERHLNRPVRRLAHGGDRRHHQSSWIAVTGLAQLRCH